MKTINPDDVVKPASNYVQGVVHSATAQRIVISGQLGQVAAYRQVRDKMLNGHLCANTYLEIEGLAAPEFLVEIEGEAVRE